MNLFKKLFGGGKSSDIETLAADILEQALILGEFDLEFDVSSDGDRVILNLSGDDEELLTEKDGQLLDAFQFFLMRALQHKLPEQRVEVLLDTNGYREESSQALIDLAERLKAVVIEKNKSVYIRALAPKDRKVVHQHLANDTRVKSKSIGDGHFKKIKIFPATSATGRNSNRREEVVSSSD